MRVAHYCKRFSGLSETFLYDYIAEEARQGVDAHVVTHRRVNAVQRPFPDVSEVPWPGVFNLRRLGYRALELVGQREQKTSAWPVIRHKLFDALQAIEPDLVHAHFGPAGVRMAPVAQALGCPLVVTFYGYDISELTQQPVWQARYRSLWSSVETVTVLSDVMKGDVGALGCPPEKVRVVHLGRDLEQFPFRSPAAPMRNLVSVGRLAEKKGHLDTIRAVERCRNMGADLHLSLIGDGGLREEIERYVQAQGLEDVVTLAGAVPNATVIERLQEADAFVLCSKTASSGDREGTPTVFIEAQAVGLPCVGTRHAGIPEMIPAANHHLLAEEGDVSGIATCLRRLMASSADELRRIAEAGRAHVEAEYNLTREVERLRQMYHRVVRGAAVPTRGEA